MVIRFALPLAAGLALMLPACSQHTENAAGETANSAAADFNADATATGDTLANYADQSADATGNALDSAGNSIDNAADATANATDNAMVATGSAVSNAGEAVRH